jgi:hypothetical protein
VEGMNNKGRREERNVREKSKVKERQEKEIRMDGRRAGK